MSDYVTETIGGAVVTYLDNPAPPVPPVPVIAVADIRQALIDSGMSEAAADAILAAASNP